MYQLPVLHDWDWTVVDRGVAPVRETREQKYVYKQLLTMGSNGFSKPSRTSLRSRRTNPSTVHCSEPHRPPPTPRPLTQRNKTKRTERTDTRINRMVSALPI